MKIYLFFVVFIFSVESYSQDFVQSSYQDFSLIRPFVADFDGDDYLDVLGNQFDEIVLQINNGTSPVDFTEKNLNLDFQIFGYPDTINIDGDNDLDLVAAKGPDFHLFILRNDGTANFTLDSLGVSGSSILRSVDIDNDSDIDIVGLNPDTKSIDIYLNDGNQIFSKTNIYTTTDNLDEFDIGDMDNDGDVDIVLGIDQSSGNQIVLLKNNLGNNFETVNVVSGTFSSLEGLTIDDLDNDGKKDIIAYRNTICKVFINQDNLSFVSQTVVSLPDFIRSARTGDYNGDGKTDIVLGTNSDDIVWLKNISNPMLTFDDAVVVGGVSPCFSIVNGDLDNDDDIDLVVTNGQFWWYENEIIQGPVSTFNFSNQEINVYPNPFRDFIKIEKLTGDNFLLEINDLLGRTVYSSKINSSLIDLSQIKSGLYSFTLINLETNQSRSSLIRKID